MTFDYEIELLKRTVSVDDNLQEKIEYVKTTILADKRPVTRNEFYQAKKINMQPSITFIINSFEYDDQEEILFNHEKYKIIRTYEFKNGLLEIICEKVMLSNNEYVEVN